MAKLRTGTRIFGTAGIDTSLVVGLGVGSTVTIGAGIVTAVSFSGSGSQLTNMVPGGNAIQIRDKGNVIGNSAIIDFGQNISVSTFNTITGICTISAVGLGASIGISDDVSTNGTRYILFNDITSGNATGLNVSSSKLTFNPSTGNMVVGGTVTTNSDYNLKTNIKTIDNALEKVLSLRGVEYDRIDNGDKQIGVIAQEVEKIIPEVVYPKTSPEYETKSVAYGNLIGLLIEAIKEQNLKITELENKIKES